MMPKAWVDPQLGLLLVKGGLMRSEMTAQLAKRLGAIVSKRGSLTLWLWGEPGIGKTHTAQELLRQTPCHKLSVYATVSSQELMALLPRPKNLADWVKNTLEKAVSLEQAATALTAWLTALAPFVLYFEDAHEASDEQLEWLNHLAISIKRTRGLALIVTSRNQASEAFEVVRLDALDQEASRLLLETEVGMGLPSEAIAWIYQHTQGNPLFTLEFFKHLARYGFLWSDGNRWRWRTPENQQMPSSVEAVIAQMLELAVESQDARTALKTRAMLGLEAHPDLWAKLSGLTSKQFQTAKHTLELHGIVHENRFVHPLFAEVAHQSLTPLERQDIARKAIELLETSNPMLAAHFLEPAELSAPEALALLERAIKAARQAGAERVVADFLMAKIGYSSDEDRGRLLLEASMAVNQFNLIQAERLAALAVQAQPQNAETVVWHARLLVLSNRLDQAGSIIEKLPDNVMPESTRWLTKIELRILRDPKQLLEVWNHHPEIHSKANVVVRTNVISALSEFGHTQESIAMSQDLLNSNDLSSSDRILCLNTLAYSAMNAGDLSLAEQVYTQGFELIEQHLEASSNPIEVARWNAHNRINRSSILYRTGRLEQAAEDARVAVASAVQTGRPYIHAVAQVSLAEILINCADYKRAEELLLEAQVVLGHRPLEGVAIECDFARLYMAWNIPYARQLALKHARDAERRARDVTKLETRQLALQIAGLVEAREGFPSQALEHAKVLETLDRISDQSQALALGTWIRGLAFERMGQHQEAIATLHKALSIAEATALDLLEIEHLKLDLNRFSNNLESARQSMDRAQAHGWLNLVNLAHRYFPEIDQTKLTTVQAPNSSKLEVLGSMRANAKPISDRNKKAKECIALLLEARIAGRREVAQLELLDNLYPDLSEDKALGALRQLVFRLRSSLGQDAILRGSAGYSLGAVSTDVEEFLETHDPSLWRGLYLEDLGEGWDSRIRDVLYDALREVINTQIEAAPLEAVRLAQILLEANPLDLEILKLCLRVRTSNSDQRGLAQWYAKSRERFLEVGENLPENWRDLLEQKA
jgi:tetratricopeptide (TPR) repeat protein